MTREAEGAGFARSFVAYNCFPPPNAIIAMASACAGTSADRRAAVLPFTCVASLHVRPSITPSAVLGYQLSDIYIGSKVSWMPLARDFDYYYYS